jgi:hypothetical protein
MERSLPKGRHGDRRHRIEPKRRCRKARSRVLRGMIISQAAVCGPIECVRSQVGMRVSVNYTVEVAAEALPEMLHAVVGNWIPAYPARSFANCS